MITKSKSKLINWIEETPLLRQLTCRYRGATSINRNINYSI